MATLEKYQLNVTPERIKAYVAEFLVDRNTSAAYVRAFNYKGKNSNVMGPRFAAFPAVAEAIRDASEKQAAKINLSADWVLREIAKVAGLNVKSFFDEHGDLIPIHKLTDEQGAQLSGFEVIIKNTQAGDGVVDRIHKVRHWDKIKALEMLAKYYGLLTERVEHSGDVSFRWQTPDEPVRGHDLASDAIDVEAKESDGSH